MRGMVGPGVLTSQSYGSDLGWDLGGQTGELWVDSRAGLRAEVPSRKSNTQQDGLLHAEGSPYLCHRW